MVFGALIVRNSGRKARDFKISPLYCCRKQSIKTPPGINAWRLFLQILIKSRTWFCCSFRKNTRVFATSCLRCHQGFSNRRASSNNPSLLPLLLPTSCYLLNALFSLQYQPVGNERRDLSTLALGFCRTPVRRRETTEPRHKPQLGSWSGRGCFCWV